VTAEPMTTAPLVLSEQEVAARLSLPQAVDAVERAFAALGRGAARVVPRSRIDLPDGVFHWLSSSLEPEHLVGSKLYTTVFTEHGERRSSCLVAFDSTTGERVAVVESYHLSLVRTAAATAVATRYLAAASPGTLGLLGTGSSALPQVEAVLRERPFDGVLVHSRNEGRRRAAAREITRRFGVPAEAAPSCEDVVRNAGVVITATNARTPIVEREWIRPGTLVNAIGSNFPDRRELSTDVVAGAARVVADSVAAARREGGDLVLAVGEGAITWDRVGELGAVVAAGQAVDPGAGWTVFKSVGIAVLDLAMVACLLDGERAGAGVAP